MGVYLISMHSIVAQAAEEPNIAQKRIPLTQLTVTPMQESMPLEIDLSSIFSDFRDAATNLYFHYGDHHSLNETSCQFMNALKSIYHGRLDTAETLLKEIASQTDEKQMLEDVQTLLVMIYQGQDKVGPLLDLVDSNPSLIDKGVIDRGEVISMRGRKDGKFPTEETFFHDGPVTLPIRLAISGTPELEVEINGVKEWFWLDTGASGTLIASDVAEAMRIQVGEPFHVDNLGSPLTLRGAMIDSLKFGPMTLKNYGAAIIDERILRIAGKRIPGIIGWPVLRRLRMEFDYAHKTVTLQSSEMRENPNRNFFWFDYPFVRLLSPKGVPLNFGLDTGADATRYKTNLLKKMTDLRAEEVTVRGADALGHIASDEGQMLDKVSFLVNNALLDFRHIKTTLGVSARFIAPDGRLGSDIFRQGKVFLDYPAGVFRITVFDTEP